MNKIFALMLLMVPISMAHADTSLKCESRGGEFILKVDPDSGEAILVLEEHVLKGSVTTTEFHYRAVFPKTDARYETHISVNRGTGEMFWEHGVKPFGEDNNKNVSRTGKCSKNLSGL